jgi:hypothetical protein
MGSSTKVERWEPIPGYEGLYEVSTNGRVRSYHNFGWQKRKNPVILKPHISVYGYPQISLCKDKAVRNVNIHRIVAMVFLPTPPYSNMQIDHINGIKTDNRVSNLEWVTPRENTMRSLALGLKPTGERHGMSKLTERDVLDMRFLYKQGGYTHRGLGKMFGVSHCVVGRILRGESWVHITDKEGAVS